MKGSSTGILTDRSLAKMYLMTVHVLQFNIFYFYFTAYIPEPCENPEQFEDYDICGEVSPDMCDDPDYVDMLAEFCPKLCSCSK